MRQVGIAVLFWVGRCDRERQGCGVVTLPLCPWHENDGNQHTPSLAVYKDKRNPGQFSFNCMTKCGDKHGDVIAFVQLFEKISFAEALRLLTGEQSVEATNPIPVKVPTSEQFEQAREYLLSQGVSTEVGKLHRVNAVNHATLARVSELQLVCHCL